MVTNEVKLFSILFFIIIVFLLLTVHHNNNNNKTNFIQYVPINFTLNKSDIISTNYAEKLVLEHFMKITPERRKLIEAIVPNPPFPAFNFIHLHHALQVPEIRCVNLPRLGTVHDGGKLICNPARAREVPNCVVYSFGISTDISYEQDFYDISGRNCKIRAIDQGPLQPHIIKGLQDMGADVLQTIIDTSTNPNANTTSFTDIVNKYGDKAIEILKMDIEGAEEKVIDQIFQFPICQILMEVHIEDVYRTVQLLKKISAHGFWLYSNELHPLVLHAREYSWIHQNCMERYGVNTILGKYIV